MKKGINIIGHLSSSSGLGNTARLFIDVLLNKGYQVAGIDFDDFPDKEIISINGVEMVGSVEELPFDFNLIIVSIQLLPALWRRRMPELLAPRFKNVGLIFWELCTIPNAWKPSLELFDAILVCSQYVEQSIRNLLPEAHVFFAEHPLKLSTVMQDNIYQTRTKLSFKENDLIFSSNFDLRSDFSRKNPIAVLNAFQAAFPIESDVRLLIKANGRPLNQDLPQAINEILKIIDRDPRITLITETLPYLEVIEIYNASDVYVSLHRSEGLGLGPMEAMMLGKLVIATGYSGNMTYMTQQNSIPVSYQLVPPVRTGWQFDRAFAGSAAAWAEPDAFSVKKAMRFAYECPEQRLNLAKRAKADIAERQIAAWDASFWQELLAYMDEPKRPLRRRALRRQVLMNEILDPTLRSLNWKALCSKLSKLVKQ